MRRARWMLLLVVLFGVVVGIIPSVIAKIALQYPTYQTVSNNAYSWDHKAMDFKVPFGTPVKAAASGTVVAVYSGCHNVNGLTTGVDCSTATCSPTFNFFTKRPPRVFCNDNGGNVVVLGHGNNLYTKYLHLDDSIIVKKGQYVSVGTVIAYSSGTGRSTGEHLHFALCEGGYLADFGINPLEYFGGGSLPTEPIVTAANLDLTETSVYIRGYLDRSWLTNKASSPSDPHIVMLGIANSSTPNIADYYEYPPTVTNLTQFGGTFSSLTPGTTYYYRTMVRLSNGKQVVSPEGSYRTPGTAPGVKVTSINISGGSGTQTWLTKGRTRQLTADVIPANATNRGVTWSSSDTSRAQVDANGLVTGISPGIVDIIATAQDGSGITAKHNFAVIEVYVTDIKVSPSSLEISVGETAQLSAEVWPADAADKTVAWTSTDSNIVRVDEYGQIFGVSVGSAAIVASPVSYGSLLPRSASNVTVVPAKISVSSVQLDATALSLVAGQSRNVSVRVLPADASNQALTWSSSNSQVAMVDNGGTVLAVGPGSCTVTVAAQDGSGATATVNVTVSVPVTGVSVTPTQLTLQAGQEGTVHAQVTPANASQPGLTWASSNTAVATVDQTGLVRAVSPGTASVSATTTDGGFSARTDVSVSAANVQSLSITSINAEKGSIQPNEKAVWTADTTGGEGQLYFQFQLYYGDSVLLYSSEFVPAPGTSYSFGGVLSEIGRYEALITVRDASGETDSQRGAPVIVADALTPLTAASVTVSQTQITTDGSAIWGMHTIGGVKPITYSYRLIRDGSVQFESQPEVSDSNSYEVGLRSVPPGAYSIEFTAKDATGATVTMSGGDVTVAEWAMGLPGDADANKSVNADDLAAMIDFIVGSIEPASLGNADVVTDGQIDIQDLIEVIYMIVK